MKRISPRGDFGAIPWRLERRTEALAEAVPDGLALSGRQAIGRSCLRADLTIKELLAAAYGEGPATDPDIGGVIDPDSAQPGDARTTHAFVERAVLRAAVGRDRALRATRDQLVIPVTRGRPPASHRSRPSSTWGRSVARVGRRRHVYVARMKEDENLGASRKELLL